MMAAARLTITSTSTLLTSRLKKPICSVVSGGTSHASAAAAAALSDIAGRALAAAAQATGSNNE